MYEIANYNKLYRPCNKSGGELQHPDFVKLPVKPKGDGLQELLEYKRGLEVFGIWCLLLEKATSEKPENRGKLLNHKEESASVEEIAKGISLKHKTDLVEYALSILTAIGWIQEGSKIKFDRYNLNYKPLKDPRAILKNRLRAIKSRAKQNNIPFDIDYDYLKAIWDKQEGKCAIARLPFEDAPEGLGAKPMACSVDRIEPQKGYVRGNIRLVLCSINVSINQWGLDYFLQISKACVEHGLRTSSEPSEQSSAKVPPKLSKDKISKGEGEGKDRFLDFVFLSKEEHSKLIAKFGESQTAGLIEDLNTGIGSKGYKYKSHYFTILSWARRKDKENPPELQFDRKKQRERSRKKIREDYEVYLRAKNIPALKDLRKDKGQISIAHWLIDEILKERAAKQTA